MKIVWQKYINVSELVGHSKGKDGYEHGFSSVLGIDWVTDFEINVFGGKYPQKL